ncbi:hypothetical protein BN79_179 [Yersinia phage phiR2-01]|uniref:Phage protein n=1 Tax=Yersinia phage phiR2-01 TaxID=1206557 RepID=I7LGY1_9CAUD|nr:hypothetical protein BN79_006 [Yersinia phage phiR2-01]YP_009237925.1 hypothetical protein BN79_179 [Yersinia phage phiR2-01]CCI88434.2 hypothetical protein BN79_006 [Yersinia phage phiR2-01]CZT05375.1 hypothetical protein BN79_179 [Yersinia phage phiR2-01]
MIKSKNALVISAKPIAPHSKKVTMLLDILQPDMKRRFKYYKRGMQQGLPMIWDNMMSNLKEIHERNKNA